MEFIETTLFTRRVKSTLTDEHYRQLQNTLVIRPDVGQIMPGSGGLRKLRWAIPGRGKRGGARLIYYWLTKRDTILMLLIYGKHEQDDLTPDQLKILKSIVKKEMP